VIMSPSPNIGGSVSPCPIWIDAPGFDTTRYRYATPPTDHIAGIRAIVSYVKLCSL